MQISAVKIGLVAGMIASALLLGACSSFQQIHYDTTVRSDGYARSTGPLATEWGKLPTYSHQQSELRQLRDRFSHWPIWMAGIDNTATVDLLVNRDGTVREVAIVESTGKPGLDSLVKPSLAGVQITTKIAPQDPAPYVFRTKVVFHKHVVDSMDNSLTYYDSGYRPSTANDWVWGNR